jgi:hypothetical protein
MHTCFSSRILSIAFLLSSFHSLLSNPKPLPSKIDQVTVFLNGAQVNRTATTTLSPGSTQLVFKEIAADINVSSIQVKGEGSFTVLSVVHQLNYLNQQEKDQEIAALETQKLALQEKIDTENNMIAVYQQEEAVLMENKHLGGQNQGVKVEELRQAADFYRSRLAEIKLRQQDVQKRLRSLGIDIEKLNRQLTALNAQKDQPTSEIIVSVSSKITTNAKLTLSYLVTQAGWLPAYDVRVKDVNSPIALIYKAKVFQQSGEDWKDVKLTLSTGDPGQNGSKPELSPWYLSFQRNAVYGGLEGRVLGVNATMSPNPSIRQIRGRVKAEDGQGLPGVSVVIKGSSIGTVTDGSGAYSLQVPSGSHYVTCSYIGYVSQEQAVYAPVMDFIMYPDAQMLSEVVVTGYGTSRKMKDAPVQAREKASPVNAAAVRNQISVDFNIEIPYTIPTDGRQYAVDMKEYEVPAYYEYYCTPKLDEDAFLVAKITDWEGYDLIPGEANLFFEGAYLGQSLLDVTNMGDTLSISLGRDKNIVVSRKKLSDYSNKQLIGSNRKESRGWETTIKNNKAQVVNLVLEDQVPLSTNSEIEVERQETSGAEVEEGTGKLTWKLKIEPAKSKKVQVKYQVKYPKKERLMLE